MSRRIEEILEVINEVRDKFQETPNESVHGLRVRAVESVASRTERKKQTVLDKFIRQLQPDVNTAAEFDRYLEKWLRHDSDELKNILLKYAIDIQDRRDISSMFYLAPESDQLLAEDFGLDLSEDAFKEGKDKLRLLLTKERNPYLIKQAKELWYKQQGGTLRCSICAFSFAEQYGDIGEGFIEAHHKIPVSTCVFGTEVRPSDLVPVCSNCHSMLHRCRPWLKIEELRNIVSDRKR